MPATRQEYIPLTTLILDPNGVPWTPEPHRRTWFVSDAQGTDAPSLASLAIEECAAMDTSPLGEWLLWSLWELALGPAGDPEVRGRALAGRLAFLSGGGL